MTPIAPGRPVWDVAPMKEGSNNGIGLLEAERSAQFLAVAQFLAGCRRSKRVSMGTRRHRRSVRLCTPCTLPRRGNTPRLRQSVCAPKGAKGSDLDPQGIWAATLAPVT